MYLVVEWIDEIGAEAERALEVRRAERVVDRHDLPRRAADRATAAMSVRRSSGLVGVSIQISLGRRPDRRAHRVEIGHVDERRLDAVAREHVDEEAVGAAVDVARRDDVIACAQDEHAPLTAAMPEANAAQCAPPSRSASCRSSAVRVGLPVRE